MYRQDTRWWSWDRDAALVPGVYLDRVVAAGGQPVLIPPRPDSQPIDASAVDAVLAALSGLVLIGGGDLEAARYGREADAHNGGMSGARDEMEFALLEGALARDLPVLAICRGMQLLNVHLGGTLHQHVPDLVGSAAHQPRAGAFGPITVTTEPGSLARALLGETTEVLCSHHQAVDRLGDGLVQTAESSDGIVEAIELTTKPFVLGVQWHPEESGDPRLFDALVAATLSPSRRALQ